MRISEIYASIQGESQYAGMPCTLVRTTGCDLRCVYCDTPYAFVGGQDMSVDEIVAEVNRLALPFVLLYTTSVWLYTNCFMLLVSTIL